MKKNELEVVNAQFLISSLLLITLIISFSLLFDEKKRILTGKRLFPNSYKYINLFNKVLFVFVLIYSLGVNYIQYEQNKKGNSVPFKNQAYASIFNLIGGIIILYVVIQTWNNDEVASLENTT